MGRGWTAAMPAREVGTRQPKVAAAAAGRDAPGREGWGRGTGARGWSIGSRPRGLALASVSPAGPAGSPISGQAKFAQPPGPAQPPARQVGGEAGVPGAPASWW